MAARGRKSIQNSKTQTRDVERSADGSPSAGYDTAGFLDYVETASDRGVGNIQLGRLNEAANLRRRIGQDLQAWVRVEAEARFAGWVIERRRNEARLGMQNSGEECGQGAAARTV